MKKDSVHSSESGTVLLEAVSFAALAFGLLLTLSIGLFDAERRQLSLGGIARNAIRDYFLHPASDLEESVKSYLLLDPLWADNEVKMTIRCSPSDCEASGTLLWLEITSGSNTGRAFGVVP